MIPAVAQKGKAVGSVHDPCRHQDTECVDERDVTSVSVYG